MEAKPQVLTTVSEESVDIDALLGFGAGPGADSVITGADEPAKPSMFQRPGVDSSFLNEETETKKPVVVTKTEEKAPAETKTAAEIAAALVETEKKKKESLLPQESIEDIIDETATGLDAEGKPKAAGRPKVDKSGLVETFSKLIESGKIVGFDDDKKLEEYTAKDFEELLEANFADRDTKTVTKVQKEFFESLPDELQFAAKYVQDGGKDLKGLFQALAHVEQVRDLKLDDPNDQEAITRNYLRATQFGDEAEIDEEVKTWKDLGVIAKKAAQFKPKLDKMQEAVVSDRLEQQEQIKKKNQAAAATYVDNVYKALETADLNGIKLDKKQQSFLYNGMVNAQYPSISGKSTNLLGHLLEKHQYVEPNYALVSEALWLLSDPKGYRENVAKVAVNTNTEDTVRRLKTEQASKTSSTEQTEKEEKGARKIARPASNFFKR